MPKKTYLLFGCLGSLLVTYILLYFFSTSLNPIQLYYFIVAVALLATALYFQLLYFIALQLILIAEHAAFLLGSGPYTQFFLPILLCCQLLAFYLMFGKDNNVFLILGILGIAFLAIGFASNNQWAFFSGSALIAIYAYYSGYNGAPVAYIWAGLNTILALSTLYQIISPLLAQ